MSSQNCNCRLYRLEETQFDVKLVWLQKNYIVTDKKVPLKETKRA